MKNEIIAGAGVYRAEAADAVREILAQLREELKTGASTAVPADDDIARDAIELAERRAGKSIRKVINATGVILHSNLGRACLSKAAVQAAAQAAGAYSTLEFDIERGKRGNRTATSEERLCAITGCKAALLVNNNAAAVLLILTAIARGGNVVISRGELVEVGGGFRIPDIVTQSGCRLREVGTTNKTKLSDYQNAIDGDTRAILKVHPSNFKVTGFTEAVALEELAKLGKSKRVPVIEDLGSGALFDMRRYNINGEPYVHKSLRSGADVVSLSGDKLLGGPQCGIILGRKKYIDMMRKHPLYRALRVDKMTIAALEATLRVYADKNAAESEIPVLTMLSISDKDLRARAEKLCGSINELGGSAEVVASKSVAGGGSMPGLELKSYAITPTGGMSAAEYEQTLRMNPVPIIGHIEDGRLLLDVRTMFEEDYEYIAEAVAEATKAVAEALK